MLSSKLISYYIILSKYYIYAGLPPVLDNGSRSFFLSGEPYPNKLEVPQIFIPIFRREHGKLCVASNTEHLSLLFSVYIGVLKAQY
jgi:hypothetical protein